jgi:hypothetical protein
MYDLLLNSFATVLGAILLGAIVLAAVRSRRRK